MSDSSKEYLDLLNSSRESSLNYLDEIRKAIKGKEGIYDEIDVEKIQKSLIFDTRNLILKKNKFRSELFDLQTNLKEKVDDTDSNIKNIFLSKLQIQKFNNNLQWSLLDDYIKTIPELKIRKIIEETAQNGSFLKDETVVEEGNDNEQFLKSVDISVDEIRRLLWNEEDIDDVNIEKYLISDEVNAKLSSKLNDSDIKKFKLVKLHDNYYQRKLSSLNDLNKKWEAELSNIKNFVSHDLKNFKNDLISKIAHESQEDSGDRLQNADETFGLDIELDGEGEDLVFEEDYEESAGEPDMDEGMEDEDVVDAAEGEGEVDEMVVDEREAHEDKTGVHTVQEATEMDIDDPQKDSINIIAEVEADPEIEE